MADLDLPLTITEFWNTLLELPKTVVWPIMQESEDVILGFGFDPND